MISIELNNINYLNNPFPHCVIDNFFDTDIANELYEKYKLFKKLEDANSKFTNKKVYTNIINLLLVI